MVPEAIWVLVVSMEISCNRSSTQLQNSELKRWKSTMKYELSRFPLLILQDDSCFFLFFSKKAGDFKSTLAFDFCLFDGLCVKISATAKLIMICGQQC